MTVPLGTGCRTYSQYNMTERTSRLLLFTYLAQVFCAAAYVVTSILMPGLSFSLFKYCLYFSLGQYVMSTYRTFGAPKFSKEWWVRLFNHDNGHYMILCVVLLRAYPSVFMLVPMTVFSVYFIVMLPDEELRSVMPASALARKAQARQQWSNPEVLRQLLHFVAISEIMCGIMAIISLLGPTGSILVTMMYWNFLLWRYNGAAHTRQAFTVVDLRFRGWLSHRFCPRALLNAYIWITGKMHQYAIQRRGGML